MFSLFSRNKMSDAPDVIPATPKTADAHPLDALTGGAFSAATSGERAARIREWLQTQPSPEQLQEVFKELSGRDKGAAKAVRERLEEIRRAKGQEAIAAEWAEKAQALLAAPKLPIADALAWQRDAAKAGAPLSREPLASLKAQVNERVKTIEDLQHRVQVQREAAVLLAQRIEVLSTKPWRDAQAALDTLQADVARWQQQAQELTSDASWASVEARFPPQLENASAQLLLVWDAFQAALKQVALASEDPQAELPSVPVWADEVRVARGLPTEASAQAKSAAAKPKVDPQVVEKAQQEVRAALAVLEKETAEGHGKASAGAAAALRAVLKVQGRWIDQALEAQVHAALIAAGELEGWQRWSADQVREELIAKAQGLLQRPEGQALGGRKIQESLRQLREQWKQADQGGAPNHALWKKFDEACNAAHKVVEAWLDKVRAEAAQHKAQRVALIDELKAWTQAQAEAASPDWKQVNRTLHQFSNRWRDSGHVGEKVFAELQPLWKQAYAAAAAPLDTAQKQSLARRQAMIDEAVTLGAATPLRIDAIKALQQRWQAEAHVVPLDRKHEQKLWDAFRKPLDDAFNRKSAEREKAATALSARDRAVLDAAKALEAANASGDAQRIRAAMQALDAALRGQAEAQAAVAAAEAQAREESKENQAPAHEISAEAATDSGAEAPAAEASPTAEAPAPAPALKAAVPRPVVAVRGDDRPGMKKDAPAVPAGRGGRPGDRRDAAGGRGQRPEGRGAERGDRHARGGDRPAAADRAPRLGDAAFRAQREALEHAQQTLKKLAAQAHGEALTHLLAAWEHRDTAQLPGVQELGGRVTPSIRAAWTQALSAAPSGNADEALLRLEIAAEAPTPAEHMSARRALQLQMLTRRNDPAPHQTWGLDAARVLASACDPAKARRLQTALKALLRGGK